MDYHSLKMRSMTTNTIPNINIRIQKALEEKGTNLFAYEQYVKRKYDIPLSPFAEKHWLFYPPGRDEMSP